MLNLRNPRARKSQAGEPIQERSMKSCQFQLFFQSENVVVILDQGKEGSTLVDSRRVKSPNYISVDQCVLISLFRNKFGYKLYTPWSVVQCVSRTNVNQPLEVLKPGTCSTTICVAVSDCPNPSDYSKFNRSFFSLLRR